VRDLALGRAPQDLDMASALLPAQVEGLFERTSAVGKAFGTVLVHVEGLDVQVTTFRRERGFSDARRPDLVEYAQTVEEDARRRDFTCNALYLDPLNDQLCDPEGGLADLKLRRLRAVGEARARFAEDGLRLVRMALFHAALELSVDAAMIQAARDSADALEGVSPERRLGELVRIFSAPRSADALALLAQAHLLAALLPGFAAIVCDESEVDRRVQAARRLQSSGATAAGLGAGLGLALLLEAHEPDAQAAVQALLDYLRPSRALRRQIENIWRLADEALVLDPAARSRLVRFARESEALDALRLARERASLGAAETAGLEQVQTALAQLSSAELHPTPWLTPADLADARVARGPKWKELLDAAETEQLEGRLRSREQALQWLKAQT
jgi:tRNA nucleotidyltransferase/poly(A) polymerase